MIDRLVHHGEVIALTGVSYPLKRSRPGRGTSVVTKTMTEGVTRL